MQYNFQLHYIILPVNDCFFYNLINLTAWAESLLANLMPAPKQIQVQYKVPINVFL